MKRDVSVGRKLALSVAIAAVAIAVLAAPGEGDQRLASRSRHPPPSYYLAVGDSVPVFDGTRSYPYLILAHERRRLPGLRLTNLAISGETTTSMLRRQYPDALAFLRAHRGHVALITIDIGGNDVLPCATPSDVSPNSPCARHAFATIRRNLHEMLAGLHTAAPGVPVIGMNYYDPILGDWLAGGAYRSFALATLQGLRVLNRELTGLYGGTKNTANVQDAFRTTDFSTMVASPWGKVPIAVQRACAWLAIVCHENAPERFGDDPNDAGAIVVAAQFERIIDRLCARRRLGLLKRCDSGKRL